MVDCLRNIYPNCNHLVMPVSWKTIINDWTSIYNESHTKQKQTDEEGHEFSVKLIVILVLVVFFACAILCLLLAVLVKWISNRKGKKEKSKNNAPKKSLPPSKSHDSKPVNPRQMKLMRSDSSLSEIVDGSRDSSLPPTPLSPLSEEDTSSFSFDRGRLEFSISYDAESECLKVTVIQAHGLPQRHCIFYVEGILLPDKTTRQQTPIRYHNPSPIFEEMFKFYLPFIELPERTLCFKVCELDNFSQSLVIGHVLYSFDMDNNNYLNLMKMDLQLSRGLPQDKSEQESDVGEVLMSLCYLPTAGRLTLVVLKCRLFKAENGLPSPFLKVSLMLNRRQVKKIKTSIQKKTLNPVYNEVFIFDVPTQHIGNVGLYARIVNDREKQEVLGKIVIGPNARTSMGVHHWECMLMSPRKPIAQWHTIV